MSEISRRDALRASPRIRCRGNHRPPSALEAHTAAHQAAAGTGGLQARGVVRGAVPLSKAAAIVPEDQASRGVADGCRRIDSLLASIRAELSHAIKAGVARHDDPGAPRNGVRCRRRPQQTALLDQIAFRRIARGAQSRHRFLHPCAPDDGRRLLYEPGRHARSTRNTRRPSWGVPSEADYVPAASIQVTATGHVSDQSESSEIECTWSSRAASSRTCFVGTYCSCGARRGSRRRWAPSRSTGLSPGERRDKARLAAKPVRWSGWDFGPARKSGSSAALSG